MARKSRVTPRARTEPEPVEIVEEESGSTFGIDEGIVLSTTLFLLAAIVLVISALASQYDAGPFGS